MTKEKKGMWEINEDDLLHLKYMKQYGLDCHHAFVLLVNIRAMKIIPNTRREHITELFHHAGEIMRFYDKEL